MAGLYAEVTPIIAPGSDKPRTPCAKAGITLSGKQKVTINNTTRRLLQNLEMKILFFIHLSIYTLIINHPINIRINSNMIKDTI